MSPEADIIRREILEGNFPRMLYKYRSFDQHTKAIFSDCKLWFGSFESFNDPFDCQIHDSGQYTSAEIAAYLKRQRINDIDATSIILRNAVRPEIIEEAIKLSKETNFKKKGLCCLSKCRDDILMWSHYCASHTGFVIGLDVLKNPGFFDFPIPITYSENYPAFRFLTEPEKILTHGMATKSKQWVYEGEIRIVKNVIGNHSFAPECLTEIILGSRISSQNKNVILGFLTDPKFRDVQIFQAKCSKIKYGLDLTKISIN